MMALTELPPVSLPLPWHAQDWELLNLQLAAGQLPHALLINGRQHTGKAQFVLALSRLLLCASREGSLNCGRCHACELSASGGHGDFRWEQPIEKSRVIKIDQVRDAVRFSNKTAGFGLRKVIVFAPADSMNVNAFNALLKSLEEPPKDTYFILVCHHMYGVPATIRSRCRIIPLPTPNTETCLDWLDRSTGKREQSQELLSLADGLPLLAKEIYSRGDAREFAARRVGLEALLSGRITVLQVCSLWRGVEASVFLEYVAGDLQRVSRMLSPDQLRNGRGRALFHVMDEVLRLRRAVGAGANPSTELLVEALVSKIHRRLGTNLLDDNIPSRIGDTGV